MARIIPAFSQYLDGEGDPLVEGFLHFTVSGTNNTDKNTFPDASETPALVNANPVPLDDEGRAPDIFGTGSYRVTMYTSDMQQVDQKDPVPGGASATSQWGVWSAIVTYPIDWLLLDAEGDIYKSLQNNNENNKPSTSPTFWEKVNFIQVYNANVNYNADSLMLFTDGFIYYTSAGTSAGESPTTDPDKWTRTSPNPEVYSATANYDIGANLLGSDSLTYGCFIANGPASSIVDPVGDNTGTWLYAKRGMPGSSLFLYHEPTATQLIQWGVLEGNGGSVLDSDYPDILTAWGSKIYGNVDGTHFNLPPLSGYFPRFFDNGAGIDPNAGTRTDRGDSTAGDNVGTTQTDLFKTHNHDVSTFLNSVAGGSINWWKGDDSGSPTSRQSQNTGGDETRPKNIYIWGGIFY